MQIKKSNVNDNEIGNQEELLLTLDVISTRWAKKLEESKLFPLLSIRRLQLYFELSYLTLGNKSPLGHFNKLVAFYNMS